jgi:antitoxin component YwqK of YwqJK toxin-antitoxin module
VKHFFLINLLLFVFVLSFFSDCKLFQKKDPAKTDSEYSLIKPNIRIEKYPNTWNMKGRGPVRLPNPDISKYTESDIKDLDKEGEWEEYDEKDNKYSVLARRGVYKDNKKEGLWKSLYETGEVLRETNFKNGKKDGVEKRFKEDGTQLEETTYIDGLEEGKYWIKTRKGFLEETGYYSKGLREKEWVKYYAKDVDGVIQSKINYKQGKKYGRSTTYHEDGKITETDGDFKSDEFGEWRVSEWKYFYDNGQLESVGKYDSLPEMDPEKGKPLVTPTGGLKSIKIGSWKKYYKSGSIFFEGFYENNRPKGEWTFYHKNGNVRAKGQMSNEFMMTEGKIYNADGSLWGDGKLLASIIKINEKKDELDSSFTPNYPFVYYNKGNKDMVVKRDEKGKFIAEQYSNGEKIGEGPITDALLRKKNGCWTLSGKKAYFIMDRLETGKIAELNKCI